MMLARRTVKPSMLLSVKLRKLRFRYCNNKKKSKNWRSCSSEWTQNPVFKRNAGPAASQFAWLPSTLEQESPILSGRSLPTNMAGICSWPRKREVAQNSRKWANKCGVPFPPHFSFPLILSQSHCNDSVALECFGIEKLVDRVEKNHFHSRLSWYWTWHMSTHVAGWWISLSWMIWIDISRCKERKQIYSGDGM